MTLCDNGHDEVCYEGKYCPACKLKDEIDQLKIELEESKGREG